MQGVRDMVINTQKTNLHKIKSILESNLSKVSPSVRHFVSYPRLGHYYKCFRFIHVKLSGEQRIKF